MVISPKIRGESTEIDHAIQSKIVYSSIALQRWYTVQSERKRDTMSFGTIGAKTWCECVASKHSALDLKVRPGSVVLTVDQRHNPSRWIWKMCFCSTETIFWAHKAFKAS